MKRFTLLFSLLFAMVSVQAQDYLISFAGTGASTTVGKVKVENLTQGTSLSLSGSEVLHLSGTYTGINPMLESKDALRIYPNPTTENSTIEFVATSSGITNVELFDITGKRLGAVQNILTIGTHSYQVSGLRSGIYTIRIYSQAYSYAGKLISNGAPNSAVKISYLGNSVFPVTAKMLKSANAEKMMQYNDGDLLKFTGASGNYSTLMTDIPTQSKKLTFTFVPCTDADGNDYPVVQIGTQIWMGENLKTTKYRNGDPIPNVTDNTLWSNLRTGAYCDYDNRTEYSTLYGRLYNWHAVNDSRNIAPSGWHVPTKDEWAKLLGVSLSLDEGFSALWGGSRSGSSGLFYEMDNVGDWWTSSQSSISEAYNYDIRSLNFYSDVKEYGYSVLCVSDEIKSAGLPKITTGNYSSATLSTTKKSGGNVLSTGGANVTAKGVCWSTSQTPTIANSKTTDGSGLGGFTSELTGLAPNTTYYLRAYATNSIGTAYGDEISFKTPETVTDMDGNVYNTVTIGTQVWTVENLKTTKYNDGTNIPNVTDYTAWGKLTTPGFCWYDNDPTNKNTNGALYNWYTINTGKLAPIGWHIPTDAEWDILSGYLNNSNNTETKDTFNAIPGGQRNSWGVFVEIGSVDYWWSSSDIYINNGYNHKVWTLNYLNLGLVYMIRSEEYGFSVRFIKDAPNAMTPTVNTISASSITLTSAKVGCEVTNIGGSSVHERGVYWGTSESPETNGAKLEIENGTDIGLFTSDLSILNPNTTYYVKAYATNSIGTGYGNEISFKTLGPVTVTDIDGNVYNTVTIGTQVWLVENLKTTRYRNGDPIPNVTDGTAWSALTTGVYCNYGNDETIGTKYGKLYNWYAVNDSRNIAPTGWHVASDAEWNTLKDYVSANLGNSGSVVKALASTTDWASSTSDGAVGNDLTKNNTSGFTALPGGRRFGDGTYYDFGYFGMWWSSTEFNTTNVWSQYINWDYNSMGRVNRDKSFGFSVRCVRDL